MVAFVAPFAVLFPWAAVPSKLGVALAGPRFFLHWLTKYPTLGPVNVEVLLGIVCIVTVAVVPAAAASYRLAGGARRAVIVGFAVMALVAWVPVLVRLDIELVAVGALGALTLLGPMPAHEALGGPLLRALAVAATIGLAAKAMRSRPGMKSPPA